MKASPLRAALIVAIPLLLLAGSALLMRAGGPSGPAEGDPGAAPGTGRIVHLAAWSNYISPQVLEQFEKSTGIRVTMTNYASNEELLAKMQAGGAGYDVVMPSDYMIQVMAQLHLLAELDHSRLPNGKRLSRELLRRPFDPDQRHSLPFDYGTTGFAVHTANLGKARRPSSWKAVFADPALDGRITLLDDVRETIGMALHVVGFSLNSRNPAELARAKEFLIAAKQRILAYSSDPQSSILSGESVISHAYSSDALRWKHNEQAAIEFVLPDDGCTLWIDTLAIPAQAPHRAEAHALINFLLSTPASRNTAEAMLVVPSNPEVFALLPPEIRLDPSYRMPPEQLRRCELIEDLGEDLELWDRIWTEIKAA